MLSPDRKKAYDIARNKRIRTERRKMLDAIKLTRGCTDCGYNQHSEALEFDHLHAKEFTISQACSKGYPLDKVLLEIAKCDVVCANCHRIRTARRRALIKGGSPPPTELSGK